MERLVYEELRYRHSSLDTFTTLFSELCLCWFELKSYQFCDKSILL